MSHNSIRLRHLLFGGYAVEVCREGRWSLADHASHRIGLNEAETKIRQMMDTDPMLCRLPDETIGTLRRG